MDPQSGKAYLTYMEGHAVYQAKTIEQLKEEKTKLEAKVASLTKQVKVQKDLKELHANESSDAVRSPLLLLKGRKARGKDGDIVDFRQEVINNTLEDCSRFKSGLDDLIGMEEVKDTFKRHIVLPLQRPEFFRGAFKSRPKILMYGPPGCGKSAIIRALAAECASFGVNFFYVTKGRVSSRYRGETEKLIEAQWALARDNMPSLIFIDEIDSFLPSRESVSDNEAAMKEVTSLMMELEGVNSSPSDPEPFFIGATNRPYAIDSGMKRRFKHLLFVDLPILMERQELIKAFFHSTGCRFELTETEIRERLFSRIASRCEGYSSDDMQQLCARACDNMLAGYSASHIRRLTLETVLPVVYSHFEKALQHSKPTVPVAEVNLLRDFAAGKEEEVEKALIEKKKGPSAESKTKKTKQVYRPRQKPYKPFDGDKICRCGEEDCPDANAASRSPPRVMREKKKLPFGRMLFESLRVLNPFAHSVKTKMEFARQYYVDLCCDPSSADVRLYRDYRWCCDIYGEELLRDYCLKKGDSV